MRLEEAGVGALHLDVMDGHFVPNLTYGMPIVAAIRQLTELPLDVHLMISSPERYLKQFAEAGADLLTIHVEATPEAPSLLREIRKLGPGAGIALNPRTPVKAIEKCLNCCDLVLVMSVMPGFGGQKFDPVALEKIKTLQQLVSSDVMIEVDGGVNRETIGHCAQAGAGYFVAGSAIFGQDDYTRGVSELTNLAQRNG